MAKKRTKKTRLASYRITNTSKIIRPGDTVTLRPPDPSTPPYIARVEHIERDAAAKISLKVRWYYRPEDSADGRQQFHGSRELFLSDHYDICSAEAVEKKCTIHTFDDYTSLQHVGADVYFSRFEYNASTGKISPTVVDVYCTCETPYNPDDLMVQCDSCEDWFHPHCLQLTFEDIRNVTDFRCPKCAR